MKHFFTIAITCLSMPFFYATQAAPVKAFFNEGETGSSNLVTYVSKSIKPMPVKSAWVKKDVVITWKTTAEVNTVYFEIQRSFDGKYYESIERITAKKNSSKTVSYLTVDSQNENRRGQTYYRLVAVFANGESAYSYGTKTKKTGVFDMNKSYAEAAGLVATK